MKPANDKMKALSKDETKYLITLVKNSKVITDRKTNATTNKLKNDEWIRIGEIFNAKNSTYLRTPQQLRLKWENLKKNARRRNILLRMNQKTGGGTPAYIPRDEILDQVLSLIGSTADGFTRGDSESEECESSSDSSFNGGTAAVYVDDAEVFGGQPARQEEIKVEIFTENSPATMMTNSKKKDTKNLFSPESSEFRKTQKEEKDDGTKSRNLAMADYYLAKKRYMDAKYENILLENEKLKLEIKELKKKTNLQE